MIRLVKDGYIKRYIIRNDGSIAIQSIYGPDDAFSLTLAHLILVDQEIYQGPETVYYEAMSAVVIYSAEGEALKDYAQQNPMVYKDLFKETGPRFHSNIQMLENLAMKSSYNRVAHQLLYYAKYCGKQQRSGTKICLPLTHQDLASILSLTRETVTNSIIKLREAGLIKGGRSLVVVDLAALQEAAYN